MANGGDIARGLATALSVIPDCRVHPISADEFRGPGLVVGLPSVSWEDPRTFCGATYTYPVTAVSLRTTDRDAATELYRLVEAVGDILDANTNLGGVVNSSRLLTATPASVEVGGVSYPAYSLTVQVIT